MPSGRAAHEQGDCNGDFTCPWCWAELAQEQEEQAALDRQEQEEGG